MSAPVTHDPRFVNTMNGACWERRAVTSLGRGLYAAAGSCTCPEFLLVPLSELAELGITGSADALPMPVVPEPQALISEQRAQIAELIGAAKPATDGLLLEMAQQIRDRREHDHPSAADWDWYCLNASGWLGDKAPTVLRRLLDAEARIAELLAERHSTNEALDTAVQELRRRDTGPALPWAHSMSDHDLHGFLDDLVSAAMGRWRSEPEVPDRTVLADVEKVCVDWRTPGAGCRLDGSEFDGAVVRLAEPEPEFHAWLHHENRLGHDLPETGGPQC